MTLIGAHLGVPWYNEALMAIRMNNNLYFDFSGAINLLYNCSDAFFETPTYWDIAKERLLYGTDTWFDQIPEVIAKFDVLCEKRGFSAELKEKLFHGNIAKILKLEEA